MIGLARLRLAAVSLPPSAAMMGVWFAVLLHLTWASVLFVSDAPKHVTGLFVLSRLFPAKTGLAIILMVVAACASYGLTKRGGSIGTRIALLTPQQIVLGVSAFSAGRAMYLGHFADGVHRSHYFLVADQAPQIFALLIHSATILYLALIRRWD